MHRSRVLLLGVALAFSLAAGAGTASAATVSRGPVYLATQGETNDLTVSLVNRDGSTHIIFNDSVPITPAKDSGCESLTSTSVECGSWVFCGFYGPGMYIDLRDGNDRLNIASKGDANGNGVGAGFCANGEYVLGDGSDEAWLTAAYAGFGAWGDDKPGPGEAPDPYGDGNDTIHQDKSNNGINLGGGDDTVHTDIDAAGGYGINASTIDGAAGNDTIYAGDGPDTLIGGAGDDFLEGGSSMEPAGYNDDSLRGGPGADVLIGGNGNDTADYSDHALDVYAGIGGGANDGSSEDQSGGKRDDVRGDIENIVGGAGNDELTGGAGANTLRGGVGDDTLDGGPGGDLLDGGSGSDTVDYSSRTAHVEVTLEGCGSQFCQDPANDGEPGEGDIAGWDGSYDHGNMENAIGGSGSDYLSGNGAPNRLDGGRIPTVPDPSGHEILTGFGGDDYFTSNSGRTTISGGAGLDTADYSGRFDGAPPPGAGVAVSANDTNNNDGLDANGDGIAEETGSVDADVENLIGSKGDDTLVGNGSDNSIRGLEGADDMRGLGGTDTATYVGHSSGVVADLDGNADDGSTNERDRIDIDFENLIGTRFVDTLTGDSGDNVLTPGLSGDTVNGSGGSDSVSYIERRNTVTVDLTRTDNQGETGEGDTVAADVEGTIGGSAGDTLTGDDGDNTLDGGPGVADDTLVGGAGTDTASYAAHTAPFDQGITATLDGKANDGTPAHTCTRQPEGGQTCVSEEDSIAADFENLTGSSGFYDALTGNDGANVIRGGPGRDAISVGAGADVAHGGPGADSITDGDSSKSDIPYAEDRLYGDEDNDDVSGGHGKDVLEGGDGEDHLRASGWYATTLRGGAGADALTGHEGADVLEGGDGADTLEGGEGSDRLDGGAGADAINGESRFSRYGGSDTVDYSSRTNPVTVTLDGTPGDGETGENDNVAKDVENVLGGAGNDNLTGNELSNTINGGRGADTMSGADGDYDTVSYEGRATSVTVDLDGAQDDGNTEDGARDTVGSDFENITGGGAPDTLTGDDRANALTGAGGADTLRAGGNPTGSSDRLEGGDGDDDLFGEGGQDDLRGEGGADEIDGGEGFDSGDGGDGDDTFLSGPGGASFSGGAGADVVTGGDDSDYVSGDEGGDRINLGAGDDQANGGAGDDTLNGGSGNDTLSADHAYGEDAPDTDTLNGEEGDDSLASSRGPDRLDGGAGSDTADYSGRLAGVTVVLDDQGGDGEPGQGGSAVGFENVTGGQGNDTLTGSDGPNTLQGGSGRDTLRGGAGADSLRDDTGYGYGPDDNGSGDTLEGDAGDDRLESLVGADTLAGGDGTDTADYSARYQPLKLDLEGDRDDGATGEWGNAAEEGLIGSDIENLTGGNGNDRLTGNAQVNRLEGLAGDDTIVSRDAVADTAVCGEGNDTVAADRSDTADPDCETVERLDPDAVAPDLTITAGPSGPTNQTSATFSFSSTDTTATFECKLDDGRDAAEAFESCTSPKTYAGLAEGSYTFTVKATDPVGNATERSRSFTIDRTAPPVSITAGPSGATTQTSATFTFSSTDTSATFQCRLDNGVAPAESFESCGSPKSYAALAQGSYTFTVKALDAAGNSSEASRSFSVDTTAPTVSITEGPADTTNETAVSFSFEANDPSAMFKCRLDDGVAPAETFAPCSGRADYRNLAEGRYTFTVRAIDAVGNSSEASRSFTIETSAPDQVSEHAEEGETVSTDEDGSGPTAEDPVETALTAPADGEVRLTESQVSQEEPAGVDFFGPQVDITAPPGTPTDPIRIVFSIDGSLLPPGGAGAIVVFRNGVAVADCTGAAGVASPDPCLRRETSANGDVILTVLTSAASAWNFGVETDGDGDGVKDRSDQCPTVAAQTANGCPAGQPGGGPQGGGGQQGGPQPGPGSPGDTVAPAIAIVSRSLAIVKGVVSIEVACPAGETLCSGSVKLTTAKHKRIRKPIVLGTATFEAAGGASASAKVNLSKKNQKLLARLKKLTVTVEVVGRDTLGNTETKTATLILKAPKAAKKRKR